VLVKKLMVNLPGDVGQLAVAEAPAILISPGKLAKVVDVCRSEATNQSPLERLNKKWLALSLKAFTKTGADAVLNALSLLNTPVSLARLPTIDML
jgi:hypothetical protein